MKAIRYESKVASFRALRSSRSCVSSGAWPISFEEFWHYILGVHPANHHREWINKTLGESGPNLHTIHGPFISIRGPRDSAKSTFCTVLAAWAIGTNPGIRIIYTSYSDSVALEQSRRVKRIISSPTYQSVFPWIRLGKRNNESEWEIDKNWALLYPRPEGVRIDPSSDKTATYTMYATGITGSIMGTRADLIISDDLTKSAQAISNKEVRSKIWDNVNSVLRPCLVNGGRWVNVSMLCRAGDINLTYLTKAYGFQVLTTKALIQKGDREFSYWPERHPVKSLKEARDRAPKMFALQYQNQEPVDSDTCAINPSWISWVDRSTNYKRYIVSVDLAAGESIQSDSTSYCLSGITSENKLHIISSKLLKRRGNLSILKDLVGFKNDCENLTVVFESNAYQSSLKGDYELFIKTDAGSVLSSTRIVGLSACTNLETRVESVSGLVENGFVFFVNSGQGVSRLVGNICSDLASLGHDDDVSSWALNLSYSRQFLVSRETWNY